MPSIGLVLGAGGLAGHAFHAGVLRAVVEQGWDPRDAEVIVGTSAGSGVAALLRAGLSAPDLMARLTKSPVSAEGAALLSGMQPASGLPAVDPDLGTTIPRPANLGLLLRGMVQPWRFRAGHVAAGLMPEGRRPTTEIGDRMRHLHGEDWPDQPLWLCTVRLGDGNRVVIGRDEAPEPDVVTAVEASSAIPGFFAPVVIDGERYVDGAVHSATNADLLADLGLDVVVVVSPMSAWKPGREVNTLARQFHHRVLGRELTTIRRSGTRVVVFEPTPDDVSVIGLNSMDPSRMASVAQQAYASATARLAASGPMVTV